MHITQEVKILIGIGILTVAILVGAVFFLSNSNVPPAKNANTKVDAKLLIKEDSHKIATDSASVTIVEFGDYQCPACGAAHPIVKQILKDYSEKVNFVFRNFPLPQHQNAQIAAEAAEAAGAQGKYWQMYDKLYESQTEWAESTIPLDLFTKYADELNLDLEQFKNDTTTNKFQQKIEADKNDGLNLIVNSTPTFFINGQKMNGFGYQEFKKDIDAALK